MIITRFVCGEAVGDGGVNLAQNHSDSLHESGPRSSCDGTLNFGLLKNVADFWQQVIFCWTPRKQTGGLPLPLGRGVCETKSKKGATETENPLCIGFTALRGASRPWPQTMVSEGARPWGTGRSEFAGRNKRLRIRRRKLHWEPVDPVVADPVRQDNAKGKK